MSGQFHSETTDVAGWARCWVWFLVALVMLLWVDLATTIAAAGLYGLESEANPIMRSLLESGLGVTVAIHAGIFLVALAGFSMVVRVGVGLEEPRQQRYRVCCLGWIGLLLIVGTGVVANNLALVFVALGG